MAVELELPGMEHQVFSESTTSDDSDSSCHMTNTVGSNKDFAEGRE